MRFKHCYVIAIAVPKNASESIHEALAFVYPNGEQNRIHDHFPLFNVLADGREHIPKYFCFSTVRDPVERFVSAWWFLQWNTGEFEKQAWNPLEKRPGTHQYLNDINQAIELMEKMIIPNTDSIPATDYWCQIGPLDYVLHPQWIYCVDVDGFIPEWMNIFSLDELIKQWPELTEKYFTWGNWKALPLPKINSTPPDLKKSVEETLTHDQIQRVRAVYEKDYILFSKYFEKNLVT